MEKVSSELSQKIANAALLAAFGVVGVHLPTASDTAAGLMFNWYLPAGLCKAAVPFFFLVSGFFLVSHIGESGWWKAAVRKRVKSLLVPYLIWSLAFAVYLFAAKPAPFAEWMAVKKWFVFGLDPTNVPLLMPLWYLRMLMLLVLVSPLLAKLLKLHHSSLFTLTSSFLLYLAFEISLDYFPDCLSYPLLAAMHRTFSPEALFFFILGMYLRLNPSPSSLISHPSSPVLPLVISVLLLGFRRYYGIWFPLPFIMIFALLAFWAAVPSSPWPKWLTSLSFPVYLMHYFITHTMTVALRGRIDGIVLAALAFFAAVVGSALIALALRRFVPRFASAVFGGR